MSQCIFKQVVSRIPSGYDIMWDDTNWLLQLLQDAFPCWQEDGRGVNYLRSKFAKLNGKVSMQASQSYIVYLDQR